MTTHLHRLFIAATTCAAVVTLAATSAAQDEALLKSYLEGRRVALRLDMPGSADGVDIRLEPASGINLKEYRNDLRRYGTAIASGESSLVTMIRVKKDLIEFQIGGGGFGTFGDDTSTSSGIRLVEKSEREKDLERRVKTETDRDRKRSLERELDDLRYRRERENRRLQVDIDRIEAIKKERIAEQRLRGGSRFNLRWDKRVPLNITPKEVEAALVEYVDFRPADIRMESGVRTGSFAPSGSSSGDLSIVRKGMLRSEAERAFGAPHDRSEKREGGVVVTTLTFDVGDQRFTGSFVEDVLVRYTISSK